MKSRLYRNVIAMTAMVMEAFGCQVAPNDRIDATLCQTDALFNVLPQTCVPIMPDDTLRVARGENAVTQFVIDAKDDLSGLTAQVDVKGKTFKTKKSAKRMSQRAMSGWVRFVRSSHRYKFGSPDSLLSPTGLYPDPIITDSTETIPAGGRALLLVDIPIGKDIDPGVYTGKVVINGNGGIFRLEKEFKLKVYSAVIPEQNLSITNWFFPDKFSFMNKGNDVEKYSQEYWECYKSLVKTAEAYGQNVWIVHETAKPVLKDGTLCFDFTDFDAQVEFLLANVNVRMIEGQHIATRAHNRWADPFWVEISLPDRDGENLWRKGCRTTHRRYGNISPHTSRRWRLI